MKPTRRHFLQAAAAILPSQALFAQNEWGGPVIDCHHHFHRNLESNLAHLDGTGISNALVLTPAAAADGLKELQSKYPGRFPAWFATTDITRPDAEKTLSAAVKSGAIGFGEIKFHVEAAGPELRRMYALAADLGVPILVHFQEVPHTPTEGVFSTGFKNFEAMLKAFPKTNFIGHADAFWANVSADYANQDAYPRARSGPAVSPTNCSERIPTCSATWLPTQATTRFRGTPSSQKDS